MELEIEEKESVTENNYFTKRIIKMLIETGKSKFNGEVVSRGACIGTALSPYLTPQEIVELAAEAMEDMNFPAQADIFRRFL